MSNGTIDLNWQELKDTFAKMVVEIGNIQDQDVMDRVAVFWKIVINGSYQHLPELTRMCMESDQLLPKQFGEFFELATTQSVSLTPLIHSYGRIQDPPGRGVQMINNAQGIPVPLTQKSKDLKRQISSHCPSKSNLGQNFTSYFDEDSGSAKKLVCSQPSTYAKKDKAQPGLPEKQAPKNRVSAPYQKNIGTLPYYRPISGEAESEMDVEPANHVVSASMKRFAHQSTKYSDKMSGFSASTGSPSRDVTKIPRKPKKHVGSKPNCSKSYTMRENLPRHVDTYGSNEKFACVSEKSHQHHQRNRGGWSCYICDGKFLSADALSYHGKKCGRI